MLRLRVDKRLGAFDLSVDLTLNRSVTGFYGPSGSGKTTLLDCVAGLVTPERGAIAIDDRPLFHRPPHAGAPVDVPVRHRRIGYVFQDGALFEHMSVAQNLRYGRRGGDGPEFAQVVDVLELGSLLARPASALSGGEKRRVALGRALLSAPQLLLLDEPLTGLDRRLAGKTLAYIRAVLDAFALPAVYVSHSVSDVIYLCDEVVVLDQGRVTAQGPPRALLAAMESIDPLRPPSLKNIFSAGVVEVNAAAGTLVCVLGEQRLTVVGSVSPDARSVTLLLPARDIILAAHRPAGLSARNVLSGKVARIEAVGAHQVVFVDVGTEWMVEVTPPAVRELGLAPGGEVYVVAKASSIQCVDSRG